MKSFLKFIGWTIMIISSLYYIFLWIEALSYIADKIGSTLAIILSIITNITAPGIYIIWHWINDGFEFSYFLSLIITSIVFKIGLSIKSKADTIEPKIWEESSFSENKFTRLDESLYRIHDQGEKRVNEYLSKTSNPYNRKDSI
jgi:hypothetical protein